MKDFRKSKAVSMRNMDDLELWASAKRKAAGLNLNLSQVVRQLLSMWLDRKIMIEFETEE